MKNGFTIVEVMIVVAVIGMLTAIAIPNYYQYIANAQKSSCLAEVEIYSNQMFYVLNNPNDNTISAEPIISACHTIIDASG